MSSSIQNPKSEIPFEVAVKLARNLIEQFEYFVGMAEPRFSNMKVSGSIRRKMNRYKSGEKGLTVGDIEIIAIDDRGELHRFLERCVAMEGNDFKLRLNKKGRKVGFGEKAKCLTYQGYALDVFTVKPEAFVSQHFIRTGPADFCKSVMQRCKYLGIEFKFSEGYFQVGERKEPIKSELEIFSKLNIPFVEASNRKGFNYKM